MSSQKTDRLTINVTDKREGDIDTEPHSLDSRPYDAQADRGSRTFLGAVVKFFRKNGGVDDAESLADGLQPERELDADQSEETVTNGTFYKHWNAIRSDGITASQFIAFLQPLADLDGITVSYSYSTDDGEERVYNRRRGELDGVNPLSTAIKQKKLSKEKALTFALNEEGRVWIESNFIDLNDLR